jgi:hypothetical protein
MPPGCTRDSIIASSVSGSGNIPPLEKRWLCDGQEFGIFLQKTFAMYYEWGLNKE